jgi:hypothetical protein
LMLSFFIKSSQNSLISKVTKLSKNILMIKSFDCGIDGTKRKIFTENFVLKTPEN